MLRVFFGERPVAFPRCAARALAPAVADLYCRHRALAADEIIDALVTRDVGVVIDAGAMVGLAAPRLDRRLFAEHDAGAAHRELAEVNEVVVGRPAAFRGILAHRRDHYAVARRDA